MLDTLVASEIKYLRCVKYVTNQTGTGEDYCFVILK